MSLLHTRAVLDAAHTCYAAVYAGEFEERGGAFRAGVRMEACVGQLPDDVQLPVAWRYLGRVEGAWGREVGLVLHHMGLRTADEQAVALCRLLLGCMGHGVSLTDDWAAQFGAACEKLGMAGADPSPILYEPEEWRDLAADAFDAVPA